MVKWIISILLVFNQNILVTFNSEILKIQVQDLNVRIEPPIKRIYIKRFFQLI